mgnify:CR=1 FL=1
MKKIQLLSIIMLSGAVLFGAKSTANKAKVNFKESSLARSQSVGTVANLVIVSNEPIHGAQFDIKYNPSEIKTIIPQKISDFEVSYNELSEGLIRGLIFSFQGLEVPENLPFEFVNAEGFEGTSTIEFKDIILADSKGSSVDVETQSYDINFSNNLVPVKTALSDCYPNPFNPTTSIKYGLQNDGYVEIMVYDAAGRLVEELVKQHQTAGYHSITWNASTQASGMYFAKMVAGDVVQTQKLVLMK